MLPFIIVVLASPLIIAAMLAYDELVLLEHERFRSQWLTDGSPTTIIRRASALPYSVPASVAAVRSCLAWAMSTPAWVREEARALRLLRRIRILLIVWTFVAAPLFLVAVSRSV